MSQRQHQEGLLCVRIREYGVVGSCFLTVNSQGLLGGLTPWATSALMNMSLPQAAETMLSVPSAQTPCWCGGRQMMVLWFVMFEFVGTWKSEVDFVIRTWFPRSGFFLFIFPDVFLSCFLAPVPEFLSIYNFYFDFD